MLSQKLITFIYRRAARKEVRDIFSDEMFKQIWMKAVQIHSTSPKSEQKHSPGVEVALKYFLWHCALYKAFLERGIHRETASSVIERINWRLFKTGTRIWLKLTRLHSAALRERLRLTYDLMFRFITTRPFERQVLQSENGVAFNVTVCPFAKFFREQEVPELTYHAACVIDAQLAEDWGIEFKRTQTIGAGYPICDFRFIVPLLKSKTLDE